MSYQVLARKWRPRYFAEMVGQEHVLQALINALDNQRLHHAYLFTGTRGVGKTTIARILAKCLNCEEGVSSKACGVCTSCREIAEGRFVDLIEVDAASRTKIEDTRELLDNVQYAPTRGRYKVYLIDEVHMLSGHSFNALLKTLEEPPPHVKFLLATTDPSKLPVTILSRCLQFSLKNLSPERIVEHLTMVLKEEKIPFDESGLWALARAAQGSMRDALSLTDQAIAHGGGTVVESEVSAMLGTIDRSAVLKICQALAMQDGVEVLRLVDELAELNPDYSAALADMIGLWHQVAVAQTVPEALDTHGGNTAALLALANALSREDVQLYYQICLLGRRDLPFVGEARVGFEMILLRQLAFEPVLDEGGGPRAAIKSAIGEAPNPVKKPETPSATHGLVADRKENSVLPARPEVSVASPPQQVAVTDTVVKPDLPGGDSLRKQTGDAPADSQPSVQTGVSTQGDSVVPFEADDNVSELRSSSLINLSEFNPVNWRVVFDQLDLGGLIKNTAANLILLQRDGSKLFFQLDGGHDALYDQRHRQGLEQALSAYFRESVQVEIEHASPSENNAEAFSKTPRAARQRELEERQQAAILSIREDPVVHLLIEKFNGQLLEETISPVEE